MTDEQIFWFVLAVFNLVASVLSVLYYTSYRREIIMVIIAVIFLLYSVAFVLTAGILRAPEPWQLLSVIVLMGSFPVLIGFLVWRVLFGDAE